MKTENKSTAVSDWFGMIEKSWTWDRLTDSERACFRDLIAFESVSTYGAIKGSAAQRRAVCHAVYGAYISGLGYSGPDWRRTEKEAAEAPLF